MEGNFVFKKLSSELENNYHDLRENMSKFLLKGGNPFPYFNVRDGGGGGAYSEPWGL